YGKSAKGAGWYSFDKKGVHFIGLVNVVNLKAGGLGTLGQEQLEWMEDDVQHLKHSTPIVVFAHIPLWSVYPEWGWGTDDSAQALGYLKKFGSVTVLNGHIHQIMQKVEGSVTGADEGSRRTIEKRSGNYGCELREGETFSGAGGFDLGISRRSIKTTSGKIKEIEDEGTFARVGFRRIGDGGISAVGSGRPKRPCRAGGNARGEDRQLQLWAGNHHGGCWNNGDLG